MILETREILVNMFTRRRSILKKHPKANEKMQLASLNSTYAFVTFFSPLSPILTIQCLTKQILHLIITQWIWSSIQLYVLNLSLESYCWFWSFCRLCQVERDIESNMWEAQALTRGVSWGLLALLLRNRKSIQMLLFSVKTTASKCDWELSVFMWRNHKFWSFELRILWSIMEKRINKKRKEKYSY